MILILITAPLGFRIWGGATVDSLDIKKLLPWIKWAYLSNINVQSSNSR